MDQFEYTPTADLGTIYPDRGPTDGGTFVSVFGENFHERSAELFYLSCRFNITSVPAMFISAEEVKCYAPEMSAGLVGVAVSNNLQDFAGGLTFEYIIVRLVRVEPSDGPVHGGPECSSLAADSLLETSTAISQATLPNMARHSFLAHLYRQRR